MNPLAEAMIKSIDWASYRDATGDAGAIGRALTALLSSMNITEAAEAWDRIEENVFSQGTIYSVAEPTVTVMLAALTEEQPDWRAGRIMDLLFFIVNGSSTVDPTLQQRCRQRVREGTWLLAQRILTHIGWSRENALEVLEIVAPEYIFPLRRVLS